VSSAPAPHSSVAAAPAEPADPTTCTPAALDALDHILSAELPITARRRPPAFARALGQSSGRRSGDPDVGGGNGGDPAAALLAEAAVLSAYRRAGRLPAEAPRSLPAPAEPDDRPPCSPAALDVLELILTGEVPIPGGIALLAGQWLEGAARAGCRVPARLLPRLLGLRSLNAALETPLRAVIGPRGRWLAGHSDSWSWAAGEPSDDLEATARHFATAAKVERQALLEAVRASDPARGRDLLASTWKNDPAAERAALLAVLSVGLADDDEPFLEAALDDRSGAVRHGAVDLLGRLPASRRAARMAARLRALVTVDSGLSFAQPAPPDAAARRDGINDAAPSGVGVSAWRLTQIVAGTPLSFWPEQLGLSAAEVVALAAADAPARRTPGLPAGGPLLRGLELAVVNQGRRAQPDWAIALLMHRPVAPVLAVLPPDVAARQLIGLLAGGLGPGPVVAELLAACPGPWPEALGQVVLDRYRALGGRAVLELQAALPVLAARLDPAALPLVEMWAVALTDDQALRRRVQTLGHALSLRAVILREFPS
jgi:hypothetical protein